MLDRRFLASVSLVLALVLLSLPAPGVGGSVAAANSEPQRTSPAALPMASVVNGSGSPRLPWQASSRVIQIPALIIHVWATVGDSVFGLGAPVELYNLSIQEGQPLPSGTVTSSGVVAGHAYTSTMTLAVTQFDPLEITLQRYRVTLDNGQSADIALSMRLGCPPSAPSGCPETGNFGSMFMTGSPLTRNVPGIGDVGFSFAGILQGVVR